MVAYWGNPLNSLAERGKQKEAQRLGDAFCKCIQLPVDGPLLAWAVRFRASAACESLR